MALLVSAGTSAGGESPVKDTYTLELVQWHPFEDRKSIFEEGVVNVQAKIEFKIVGPLPEPYDPDVDDRNWEGETISEYLVFQKKEVNAAGEVTRVRDSYLSDKSNAYYFLDAVMGRPPTREDEIEPEDYEGKRLKATIEPKSSGWPKVHNFARARRAAAATAKTDKPAAASSLKGTTFDVDEEDE